MSDAYSLMLIVHGLNRWLALAAGTWLLVILMWGVRGGVPFGPLERGSLAVFIGSLHAQAILGAALWALAGPAGQVLFEGEAVTRWLHMGGGLLAAVLATLALALGLRTSSDKDRFRSAVLWSGLAFVFVFTRPPVVLALLAVCILVRWLLDRTSGQVISREPEPK